MRRTVGIFSSILIFGLLLVYGCETGTTPIGKITQNPREYADRAVTISGEVTEVFSLFVLKYFVVKDGTGQISVVSDKPLPKKGAAIKVKGTVKEAFSIGDQQLLVLVESAEK